MPVRLSQPFKNLGSVDLQRDARVRFDKIFGGATDEIIASCPLPLVTNCQVVNVAIPISGGTPPYVWALVGGALPLGLVLNPGGTITGTVNILAPAGLYNYDAQVTDSLGQVVVLHCSMKLVSCSTLEADHPVIQTFHPPFDGTGMTPIIYNNVPVSFPFLTDAVQFRYNAGQLVSNNTSRPPFLPVMPCPPVPTSLTTQNQAFFPTGFPVGLNQEASMTLGDWAYGGGATALNNFTDAIGPAVRIRKINPAFPLEFGGPTGNNLQCFFFGVQHNVEIGVNKWESFIAIRNAGLVILHSFPVDFVGPGDVLTIQALCQNTYLRAKVNGVVVFEGNSLVFSCADQSGVAGIIAGTNVPTYCDQIWATDFEASVRS